MTESCSGLKGSLSDVTWYSVPGQSVGVNGEEVGGYWSSASNRIVVAGDGLLVGTFIRHEMLHALVGKQSGHPREYFLDRCGGVVSCARACVADAGPAPNVDALISHVSSSALTIGVSVVPDSPNSAVDGGVFTVIVTATNPGQAPIVVDPDAKGFNQTFRYMFSDASGSFGQTQFALDSAIRHFGARETKRQYFDFVIEPVAGDMTIPPGTYRVLGGYDATWTTIDNVKIGP